jgi:anthranilate synthase/indole-3-glycerol phosphate synthase/phosphoribosylanthranilate isomerase
MAVRHREACVEAVQYHPESCMSEGGKGMMANFIKMKGGTWGGENAWCGVVPTKVEKEQSNGSANGTEPTGVIGEKPASGSSSSPGLPTILNRIHAQRLKDVEEVSSVPATTPTNITKSISLHTCPPLISFVDRVKSTPHTAVMAEIKRASPSKGDIAPNASAPEQGLKYALAGASVISVLTEPKWFKGSLVDMLAVRNAIDSIPNRPAILRKDFIVSTYQIDEARLYGADTVLLIVAMLEPALLKELYSYSVSIGMEPLVEVNNPTELNVALDLGSKVIGVNNRNLHDFNVDMSTTSRVNAALQGRDVILCALSGISKPEDVDGYVKEGVKAVLVGESLMRASDPTRFLRSLVGLPPISTSTSEGKSPLVKICGIRSVKDAQAAMDSGADMIGIVLLPGVKRSIPHTLAREISLAVQTHRNSISSTPSTSSSSTPTTWFAHHASRLASRRKPLLVGVFRNQPLSDVLDAIDYIGLDMVQLHGTEPQEYAKFIPVPVIKTFAVDSNGIIAGGQITRSGTNQFILLDAAGAGGSGGGGEGKAFPWEYARKIIDKGEVGTGIGGAGELANTNEASPGVAGVVANVAVTDAGGLREVETGGEGPKLPVILAGGLNADNVGRAIKEAGEVVGVDVSSGVEGEDGWKDLEKIKRFVAAVKG